MSIKDAGSEGSLLSVKELIKRGEACLEEGDADGAIAYWKKARLHCPGDPALQEKIERARQRQREAIERGGLAGERPGGEEARPEEAAEGSSPLTVGELMLRGEACLKSGDAAGAIEHWKQAQRHCPGDPALAERIEQARQLQQKGREGGGVAEEGFDAIEETEQPQWEAELAAARDIAVEESPSPAEELLRRGEACLEKGDADGAIECWKKAQQHCPGDTALEEKLRKARQVRRKKLLEQRLAFAERCAREGMGREAVRGWTDALELLDEADPRGISVRLKLRKVQTRYRIRKLVVWSLPLVALLVLLATSLRTFVVDREQKREQEAAALVNEGGEDERRGELERACERYAELLKDHAGTEAAGKAEERMRAIRRFTDEAARQLQAAGEALEQKRFVSAREALDRILERREFAGSKFCEEAARLYPWAYHGKALERAKAALEGERFSEAMERFENIQADSLWTLPEIDRQVEEGLELARFGYWAQEGQKLLEEGRPREARELFVRANELAARVGRDTIDLEPVEELIRKHEGLDFVYEYREGVRLLCQQKFSEAGQHLAEAAALRPDDRLTAQLLSVARAGRFPEGMVLVPGGPVLIGSLEVPDEMPPKLVELEPFFIDVLEMTRGEYANFVAETGGAAPPGWEGVMPEPGSETFPVGEVTWDEAAACAGWVGKRLPSEEQWEAAARALVPEAVSRRELIGKQEELACLRRRQEELETREDLKAWKEQGLEVELPRRYPWGNFWEERRCPLGEGLRPVGSVGVGAGALGCFDQAGNVWEWTASSYLPYHEVLSGPPFREDLRVIRGGSWRATKQDVRCANRAAYSPGTRFDDVGFRCAASLEQGLRLLEEE